MMDYHIEAYTQYIIPLTLFSSFSGVTSLVKVGLSYQRSWLSATTCHCLRVHVCINSSINSIIASFVTDTKHKIWIISTNLHSTTLCLNLIKLGFVHFHCRMGCLFFHRNSLECRTTILFALLVQFKSGRLSLLRIASLQFENNI